MPCGLFAGIREVIQAIIGCDLGGGLGGRWAVGPIQACLDRDHGHFISVQAAKSPLCQARTGAEVVTDLRFVPWQPGWRAP